MDKIAPLGIFLAACMVAWAYLSDVEKERCRDECTQSTESETRPQVVECLKECRE